MNAVSLAATTTPPVTDLVLEGGGVKGIALVGALEELSASGFTFARIAGTSAGAIVGAVLAAMQQRGEPMSRLSDITNSLDYRKFRDRGAPGKWLGPLGLLTDGISLIFEDGAYEGDYLHDWLSGVLREFDVRTFGDLRVTDDDADAIVEAEGGTLATGVPESAYRLVVMASDLSRRRLVKLPWDYPIYGLDPDEQLVADAVRASASTPYFFEPVQLRGTDGVSTLVDGGLISNYPISVFDRIDGRTPRWPTIGVRLDALGLSQAREIERVRGPVDMGLALIETAIEACQAEHVLDPCNVARSVFIDTATVSALDFSVTTKQQQQLLRLGRESARQFLAEWSWESWLRDCSG